MRLVTVYQLLWLASINGLGRQAAAISTYFNTVPRSSLPSQEYNKNGRGFPDLSSCGVDMSIVARGEKTTVGGTSCSAPTVCVAKRIDQRRNLTVCTCN